MKPRGHWIGTDYRHAVGRLICFVSLLIAATMTGTLKRVTQAQDSTAADTQAAQMLATVNDFEITDRAVLRSLIQSLPNLGHLSAGVETSSLDSIHPALVRGTLETLIKRRIVFEYLRENRLTVGRGEIELELKSISDELAKVGLSLTDHLQQQGLSQPELEFEIQWRIVWDWYRKKILTDEFIEQHFLGNRRRFDNSEMRVAHLLLQLDDDLNGPAAIKKANDIFGQLNLSIAAPSGQGQHNPPHSLHPFDESKRAELEEAWRNAVKRFSSSPSAEEGGEIGWIRFQEPMPEVFSVAAFRLQVGEISRPVVTPFGVHLIRCLEIREGKMGWRDAKLAIAEHAAKILFERIASEHRSKVSIKRK